MTPAIKEVMLAVSGSLAASVVAKVTAVTALALFAVWLAREPRGSASCPPRRGVWWDVTVAFCVRGRAGPPL